MNEIQQYQLFRNWLWKGKINSIPLLVMITLQVHFLYLTSGLRQLYFQSELTGCIWMSVHFWYFVVQKGVCVFFPCVCCDCWCKNKYVSFLNKLNQYGILYLFVISIFFVSLCIHNVKLTLQSSLRKHSKMSYTLISTGSIYSIYTITQY